MNPPNTFKTKSSSALALAVLLTLPGSASAALVVSTANTNSSAAFTPDWAIAGDSLLTGLTPTSSGNFQMESAGGVSMLNDGAVGLIGGGKGIFATAGNNGSAGHEVVYTLPETTYGYDVTNITVYSGWGDNGRDAQSYFILYATKASPTTFLPLGYVSYNPSVGGGRPSANRVIFADSAGAAIAANVAALKFDFSVPGVENGWAGYAEITVQGTPSSAAESAPPILITTENQNSPTSFTPTWPIETGSRIAGQMPSRVSLGGVFTLENSAGVPALTDGTLGPVDDKAYFATCGGAVSAGKFVIYTLAGSPNGSDLTNIVVYSGWGSSGRDGQYYNIYYSTVAAPTTFIPLTRVYNNPYFASGMSANRVSISTLTGEPLAVNVHSVKFDFSPQFGGLDNGYTGYAEIVVLGDDSAPSTDPLAPLLTEDTLPTYAEATVGDQVIFTAAFGDSPAANLQWEVLTGGTTNAIVGATGPTLTLNNVQLSDAGQYRLKAVNTADTLGVSYSTPSLLVVSNLAAPVGGVIVARAAQAGQGYAGTSTNFYPTWTIDPASSLINASIIGFNLTPGAGNFGLDQANMDPTVLTDGAIGYFNYWPNVGSSIAEVTCGVNPAGASLTYVLPQDSTTGYDLTNIMVFGGWGDSGRNQQKYQVLYSTVAAPFTFNHLVTVDYNLANPNNPQSATRTTVLPSGESLAQNVYAVQFNFNLQGAPPKNAYEGYSEILVSGVPSAPKPVSTQDITPLTAKDVVGSKLVIMAGFDGATSYQWQKDGMDIPGATTSTLTLENLQLSDTATADGYRLVAQNASGTSVSRACKVTVLPAPEPVDNIVTAFAYQTSDQGTFSPTWGTDLLGSSLIAYAQPTENGTGNFNDPDVNHPNTAGGLQVLTDGQYGTLVNDATHPAFATCGPNAGQFVTYTLPASSYGYDLTGIVIAGGWNDSGRDAQFYTVSVSTPNNPTTFTPLVVVSNNPALENDSNISVIRSTFAPAIGILASNVYAIQVDFTWPTGVPNGYSGYSEISVMGTPSGAAPVDPLVSVASENSATPSWVVETDNLIAGKLPDVTGTGSFAGSFNGEPAAGGLPVLTDGVFGTSGILNFATCGGAYGAGSFVTYIAPAGWELTNIVVYSGWGNYDRDGQFYDIYYATRTDPATQIKLASVMYNPPALTGDAAARVAITPLNGLLATDVHSVTFDFTPQRSSRDHGYSGYAEIVLQGSNLAPIVVNPPVLNPPVIVEGNIIMTGTGGTPNAAYSWMKTTSLTPPVIWTTHSTGVLDETGALSDSIPMDAEEGAAFFRLRMP